MLVKYTPLWYGLLEANMLVLTGEQGLYRSRQSSVHAE